jgi:hexosaminidase
VIAALVLAASAFSIVPQPVSMTPGDGTFQVPPAVEISAATPQARHVADFAQQFLRKYGIAAAFGDSGIPQLKFEIVDDQSIANEGYRLNVDSSGIDVQARSGEGLFYGLQTLEQLFPAQGTASLSVPFVRIADAPQFAWRGLMLDVSRHFYTVPQVERILDLEAHYKLNVFHWHLSDDQGWRIQIKRYPRLTTVGACRAGTEIDKDPYAIEPGPFCQYYTQDQIRAVVAYAKARYITVIPEIDMPGHSAAAIAAYPFLGCGKRVSVSIFWGGSTPVCPGPKTVAFEENVLSEVMDLFPAPFVHIGGDEVPAKSWPPAQRDAFEQQIERFLEAHGRRPIGWDEILDTGISPRTVIMSWRGTQGGIRAAQHGNDVVMTPDGPLYFDAYQGSPAYEPEAIGGLSTLQMVYGFDPYADLTPAQRAHILGVQANVWTEYIGTQRYLEYMILPRALALSEIAWTPPQLHDWFSFRDRTGEQYEWLAANGYDFRIPNPTLTVAAGGSLIFDNVSSGVQTVRVHANAPVTLTIADPILGGIIRYTSDTSDPTAASPAYTGPLTLACPKGGSVAITAVVQIPGGRLSTPSQFYCAGY